MVNSNYSAKRWAGGPAFQFFLADESARRDDTISSKSAQSYETGFGGAPFLFAAADKGGVLDRSVLAQRIETPIRTRPPPLHHL